MGPLGVHLFSLASGQRGARGPQHAGVTWLWGRPPRVLRSRLGSSQAQLWFLRGDLAEALSTAPLKAALSRTADAAALEGASSPEEDLGHRRGETRRGRSGAGQAVRQGRACPRESAGVSAWWLAPLHLTALAPTPPWLLPGSGYNSETVRITPRHLAPHAS